MSYIRFRSARARYLQTLRLLQTLATLAQDRPDRSGTLDLGHDDHAPRRRQGPDPLVGVALQLFRRLYVTSSSLTFD
jgi:hypothetical protein